MDGGGALSENLFKSCDVADLANSISSLTKAIYESQNDGWPNDMDPQPSSSCCRESNNDFESKYKNRHSFPSSSYQYFKSKPLSDTKPSDCSTLEPTIRSISATPGIDLVSQITNSSSAPTFEVSCKSSSKSLASDPFSFPEPNCMANLYTKSFISLPLWINDNREYEKPPTRNNGSYCLPNSSSFYMDSLSDCGTETGSHYDASSSSSSSSSTLTLCPNVRQNKDILPSFDTEVISFPEEDSELGIQTFNVVEITPLRKTLSASGLNENIPSSQNKVADARFRSCSVDNQRNTQSRNSDYILRNKIKNQYCEKEDYGIQVRVLRGFRAGSSCSSRSSSVCSSRKSVSPTTRQKNIENKVFTKFNNTRENRNSLPPSVSTQRDAKNLNRISSFGNIMNQPNLANEPPASAEESSSLTKYDKTGINKDYRHSLKKRFLRAKKVSGTEYDEGKINKTREPMSYKETNCIRLDERSAGQTYLNLRRGEGKQYLHFLPTKKQREGNEKNGHEGRIIAADNLGKNTAKGEGGLLDTPATGADSSSTSSEQLNNMSRLNGRVHHTGSPHNPVQYQPVPTQYSGQVLPPYQDNTSHIDEYEPSCLVRTPSGNVYIPSEDIPKNSTLDYKQGIHSPNIHSPIKGDQKAMESYNTHFGSNIGMPVVPLRNNLRRPGGGPSPPSSYEGGMNERGNGVSRRHLPLHQHRGVIPFCSWRCTAILFITIAFVLAALLAFFTARSVLSLPTSEEGCGIILDEASSVSDEARIGGLSPTRGNLRHAEEEVAEAVILQYDLPSVPRRMTWLDALRLKSSPVKRMRRSVPHVDVDLTHGMKPNIVDTPTTSHPKALHDNTQSPLPLIHNDSSLTPSTTSPNIFDSSTSDSPVNEYTAPNTPDELILMYVDSTNVTNTKLSELNAGKIEVQDNKANSLNDKTNENEVSNNHSSISFEPVVNIVEYSDSESGANIDFSDDYQPITEDDVSQSSTVTPAEYEYGNPQADTPDVIEYDERSPASSNNSTIEKKMVDFKSYEYSDKEDSLISLPSINGSDVDNIPIVLQDKNMEVHKKKPLIYLNNGEQVTAVKPTHDGFDSPELPDDAKEGKHSKVVDADDEMLGDDPNSYESAPKKGKTRDLWSLGWLFNTKKSSAVADDEEKELNNKFMTNETVSSNNVTKYDTAMNASESDNILYELRDEGYIALKNSHEYAAKNKGGRQTYAPFSTWSSTEKDKFKKGGKETEFLLNDKKSEAIKGGKVTEISTGPQIKSYYKRSTRTRIRPQNGEMLAKEVSIPTKEYLFVNDTYFIPNGEKRKKSYNAKDSKGGSISKSHSRNNGVKATGGDIENKPPEYYDDAGNSGANQNTAYDLFPHIFEYDLDEDHDEYYYEEEKPWFDEFWSQKEKPDETPFIYDEKGKMKASLELEEPIPASVQQDPYPIIESQLPEGLKVMALTREEFHVDTPGEPKVVLVNETSGKVTDSKVYSYNIDDVEIVPLAEPLEAELLPIKEDIYVEKIDPNVIVHNTANDVYVHSTKVPQKVYIPATFTENSNANHAITTQGLEETHVSFTEEPILTNTKEIVSAIKNKYIIKDILSRRLPEASSGQESIYSVDDNNNSNIFSLNERSFDTEEKFESESLAAPTQSPTITENKESSKDFLPTSVNTPDFKVQVQLSKVGFIPLSESVSSEPKVIVQSYHNGSQHILAHNSARHPKRVTVNVTIATEDDSVEAHGKSNSDKPVYVLSVSVPTSGENDNAEINFVKPEISLNLSSAKKTFENIIKNKHNSISEVSEYSKVTNEDSSLSATNSCECSCPCKTELSDDLSSKFSVNDTTTSEKLHNTTHLETNSTGNHSEGCVIVMQRTADSISTTPTVPSTSTTQKTVTITPPTLPPHFYFELREHQQRPHQTIPPDGTTFKMVELGHKLKHKIPPYGYWNMQFYQPESAYVKFEVAVPRGASLGIYGRRNALPTHTSYDFLQVLSGYKVGSGRNARSSLAPTQIETLVKYLDQGHWFLSVYNDDGDPQELSLGAHVSSEYTEGCPKGCSNNGDCILGSCQCYPGFTGPDCTQMKCPVLCSGNGEYREGNCICRPGWKGNECSVRHDECEVPDCNGHGHCVDGRCMCAKGFKGQFCEDVDCPHPLCSGHGWCVNGTCICQKGWRGPDCARMDDAALQCLPDCSGHGHFDLVGQQCVCEPEWTGSECNKRVCGLDCGYHGRCEGGHCLCFDGWTGDRCDLMVCDPRCENHGQCKNGTCICMTGWNGRHCTLAGCPGSCSGHGSCAMVEDEWTCNCSDGWEGPDCGQMLEDVCDDNIDNDNDGLLDCADAECCASTSCTHSTLCKSSVDPIDILLRKQPPAVTASFFQKMRFIVEENSVQVYADPNAFNQSRSSVVRGRIMSGRGSGLVGVRVSHFRPKNTGFTLSRQGGWFDLMVNGGGAVKLHFGKSQFLPVTKTVWVPWNEIVVIDTVIMTTSEVVPPPPPPSSCPDHDYNTLKPVVLATWKHGFQGGCPQCSAILTESQVVQESLPVPGTGLHLVYHSSRALGYESTIQLQLTPSEIPQTLRRIYLRITIEGILFEKTFEADTDIKFTYAWNRLNVYRQRVYGVTWAIVRVGYAYSNCDQIIWDTESTQVSGHDMSVSDIGGWDLSIHHRYNFHEGILQKGDGTNIYLKQRPRVLKTLMGDGRQREVSCKSCEGPSNKQRLLTPSALAAAPDGSLYIGDFNLIRRIFPDNTVKTIVKLNETRVSYRYHLAVSPVDGSVYLSDPEAHQILKVKDPLDTSKPEDNFMPHVGSGERCLPGDEVGCGDGGLARDAKLQYPKGMAISSEEVLYFADGTNVRAVDTDGIISTIIGTHQHRSHWQPLPCSGTLSVIDVSLRWPTSLAVSPLDESIYVLDDHHVLRLTKDGRIKVIAGRPLHCPPVGKEGPTDLAAQTTIRSPQSLAFTPNGDLYIAESDTERINRIRIINTDERIHDFAGAESKCNCRDETCKCYDESHVLAATSIFSTISAIAVTPDGAVHVLDQGNLRIRSVVASIPQPTKSRDYEIYCPETQEMYIFNRFGHHIETRNIPTQRSVYIFIYNVNTSNGKLSSVTDATGNKINFLRDYTGQVTMIENSRQQKCRLKMSRMRRLEEMVTPDEHNVTLTYHGSTGLLRSRMDSSGRAHVYTYDKYGRLTRTVTPSGQVIDLSFDLSEQGARVTVTRDGGSSLEMLIKGAIVTETVGSASSVTSQLPDSSVIIRNAWGHHISTETVSYSLLQDNILANSFPVPGRQRTEINDELVNSFEWKYFVEVGANQKTNKVGRKMRVNGEDLLSFEYDMFSGTEAVLNKGGNELLNVTYDDLGRPLKWSPATPFQPVSLKYDRYGLLQEWSWGKQREDYVYDRAGRFEGITYADGSKITYSYKDVTSIKPYKVAVDGGTEHLLEYDDGGALSAITTPRGHKYIFQLQPSVLHNRFTFTPAGTPLHPYQILYSDNGQLLAKVLPQQAGRVIYNYDEASRLQHQIFGDGSVEYGYQPETGLIRSVTLRELAYEQRIDNKYHAGLVKEQRIRFGPAVPLNAAKMRFLYDGNARPRRVEVEINGQELSDYEMKYDMILGVLENVDDLKITKSYHNKTVIQDSRKTMLRIALLDSHGRLEEETLTIHGRLVHQLRYEYDLKGRISSKTTWRGAGSVELLSNYTYTPDGFLQSVEGAESWQFRYDKNGNMISVVEGGREITAVYDMTDKLIGWGDDEINTFDAAGRAIRQGDIHFSYTARGNIRHAWKQSHFRATYRHDHRGRLTSWEDHHGNVTQFFYADLKRPYLPTHIHYPSSGETHIMFYDDRGRLIAMQTENGRLWVITDHVGTPVAVYDTSGVLAKEIRRSPWGETLRDSRPELKLYIDFFGSIRDPITGLLIFQMNTYDPGHGQWMAPRYDRIPYTPEHITAIYLHRFKDNNPVNKDLEKTSHYTDTNDWLKLFSIDMSKMLGSMYHDETIDDPVEDLETPNIEPSMRVISGLSCSKESVLKMFSKPTLLPESLVLVDEPRLATSKWSMLGKFSSTGPVLGPGILVSRIGETALVTLVPHKENSVVQAVARDVLNGSALLDVTLPHHRHHTLYLLKEDVSAKEEDLEQLQRLSGLFNITSHDGEHPEIRVVGLTASLVFLYGTTPDAARHRLLRHVHHRAAEHAWQAEKRLLESGGPSLHPWTAEERETLLREGQVPGFVAAELHSVHRFPLLADDASNVVFRRDVDHRRRRSKALPLS